MNRVTIEHGSYKIVLEHPENDGGWTAEQVVERLVRPAMLGLTYSEGTLLVVLGPENEGAW